MTAAALIQRYAQNLVETGGTPHHWISVDAALTQAQANDLQQQWVETRTRHAGEPAVLSRGATLNQTQAMSAKDLALVELEQFNETRIAVAMGVPPFLAGLPSPVGTV
jgi:phage portal protein BeeE